MHLLGRAAAQVQIAQGIFLLKALKERPQLIGGDIGNAAQGQHGTLAGLQGLNFLEDAILLGKHFPGQGEQRFPRGGKRRPPGRPVKQGNVQPFLQALDVLGQAGLRGKQKRGRPLKALHLRNKHKFPKIDGVHRRRLLSSRGDIHSVSE